MNIMLTKIVRVALIILLTLAMISEVVDGFDYGIAYGIGSAIGLSILIITLLVVFNAIITVFEIKDKLDK